MYSFINTYSTTSNEASVNSTRPSKAFSAWCLQSIPFNFGTANCFHSPRLLCTSGPQMKEKTQINEREQNKHKCFHTVERLDDGKKKCEPYVIFLTISGVKPSGEILKQRVRQQLFNTIIKTQNEGISFGRVVFIPAAETGESMPKSIVHQSGNCFFKFNLSPSCYMMWW